MATDRGYAGRVVRPRGLTRDGRAEAAWPGIAVDVPRTHARIAALALAGLFVAAVVVRALLSWRVVTPWIMVDEFVYSELAKNFADHGRFLIRGVPFGEVGRVYPVVISPAWLWHSMAVTYGIAKTLNAVVMCLAAVPAYLWARRLVSPLLSLAAAGLVLLLPAFVYTSALMTENAAFPTFLLGAFAIALALERPTLWAQAFALVAAGLATAVRVQAVALFAVLAAAVVLKVLLDLRVRAGRPWALVRPHVPMLAALGVLGLAYIGLKLAEHASVSSGLGTYSVVVGAHYPWGEVWHWFLYHLADLSLAVGVVPLAALIVLAGLAAVRGLPGSAERAFVAVAVPAVLLVVFQVALYASRFALRIEERNLIYLMPILVLAFIVWIGRGLPRPIVIASVAAFGSAALLLELPLRRFVNATALSDTFALIPLLRLWEHVSQDFNEVRWIMLFAALDAALAFLFLPRRIAAVVLPLFLAGYFAYVSSVALDEVSTYSRNVRAAIPADASWVDKRIGPRAHAAYLYGANPDPMHELNVLWQLEFWNRSLDRVYNFGTPSPIGIPEDAAAIQRDGRVTSSSPGLAATTYLVADRGLALTGRLLGADGEHVLFAASHPIELGTATHGVYPDGWMSADATYDRYTTPGRRPGTLDVVVSRASYGGPNDRPGHVVIEVGPIVTAPDGSAHLSRVTARRRWTVNALSERRFRFRTPRPPFGAHIQISPTFSPADYGLGDVRQLGAQVGFSFAPSRRG